MKTTIARNSIPSLLLIPLALGCFAVSPTARAVTPAPDGGYPGDNTAEGDRALLSLTTGGFNTAIGESALEYNTSGTENTATGASALQLNRTGYDNTATGFIALQLNRIGHDNTATGWSALTGNTTGNNNTATGWNALTYNNGNNNTATGRSALESNTTGSNNTANGVKTLFSNTTGSNNTANGRGALNKNTSANNNTADGYQALNNNNTGYDNTATGASALFSNTAGFANTAIGYQALYNSTGSGNIAVGVDAGTGVYTGNDNIDIDNLGMAGESYKIRIGTVGVQNATFVAGIYNVNEGGTIKAVYINSNGQLGTQAPASSRRFKKEIKPMDQTSEAVLALKPVTFQYKSDSSGTPQFGLIAEEVAKVNPDLVVRDEKGEIYTVRYDAVNAMLLNEFLKEHKKVEGQQATIAELKSTVAQQQKGMEVLTAQLNKQAAQIQKVSAQLEASKPAPQVVNNDQ